MPEQEKGFVVKDRRMFSQEGQPTPPEEPGPAEPKTGSRKTHPPPAPSRPPRRCLKSIFRHSSPP